MLMFPGQRALQHRDQSGYRDYCDRGKWQQDDQNYRANYSIEGAFQASNQNIADAVNSVLTDTIADMSQDTSIHDFIKQNAR